MTENQFYALLTTIAAGFALVGAAIRFAASRIIKAMDDSTAAVKENTASNAVLSTKIDHVSRFVSDRDREPTPVHGVPAGAYSYVRPKTEPPR